MRSTEVDCTFANCRTPTTGHKHAGMKNDTVTSYKRERERDIFISPWLQVCVMGPRHHLASSLLTKCRGQDEKEICTWVTGMVV